MAEQIQDEERDAQRRPDQQSDQVIDLLINSLQHQSLTSRVDAANRTNLLKLPLVLVRQILQNVVQCYITPQHKKLKLFALLELRRVHKFFDAEITWLLGRDLERWDKVNRKAFLYRAPTRFIIRILEACIGDRDRGGCDFATHMHSVVDTLVQQFKQLGASKEREEMLHAVCHTFATRPWQRELFRWRLQDWHRLPEHERLKRWNPMPTAFVVAMHAKFDNLLEHMLQTYPIVPFDIGTKRENVLAAAESFDFGLPIDLAITSGQTTQVQMLLDHGAELVFRDRRGNSSAYTAVDVAARRGHAQVLDLVLPQLFSGEESQDGLHVVGRVMRMAARHQQWHIVHSLIEQHARAMKTYNQQEYLDNVLCIASRYGQDDVVRALLEWAETPTHCFPLRDAAGGGHLSTCELLLWEGPRPEQLSIVQQSEVFARAVARGGNVEACKLLRPHRFWRDCHEIHFLPIAAELGHLEFAKYAVANRCDRNPPAQRKASTIPDLDRRVRYPDDIRYFALLRAIISGHEEVVRWLVNDLGVDIGPNAELVHSRLDPWHLALHANTSAKLRQALGVGNELGVCDCGPGARECKEMAIETLDVYQKTLRLRKDYGRDWCNQRSCDV